MNEIEIMNLRKNKIEFEYDIRVDRYNKILELMKEIKE